MKNPEVISNKNKSLKDGSSSMSEPSKLQRIYRSIKSKSPSQAFNEAYAKEEHFFKRYIKTQLKNFTS